MVHHAGGGGGGQLGGQLGGAGQVGVTGLQCCIAAGQVGQWSAAASCGVVAGRCGVECSAGHHSPGDAAAPAPH